MLQDPNFLGALIGSVITGLIAICIFMLGNREEKKKKEELINNYSDLIREIHKESIVILKEFRDSAMNKVDIPHNYQANIMRLINQTNKLNLIEINTWISRTDKSYNIVNYINSHQNAVQLVVNTHGEYGNIFFKYGSTKNDLTNIAWLDYYVECMEKNIKVIK